MWETACTHILMDSASPVSSRTLDACGVEDNVWRSGDRGETRSPKRRYSFTWGHRVVLLDGPKCQRVLVFDKHPVARYDGVGVGPAAGNLETGKLFEFVTWGFKDD